MFHILILLYNYGNADIFWPSPYLSDGCLVFIQLIIPSSSIAPVKASFANTYCEVHLDVKNPAVDLTPNALVNNDFTACSSESDWENAENHY